MFEIGLAKIIIVIDVFVVDCKKWSKFDFSLLPNSD